jgi:glycosyltransferase involved in cell wall biosynthesis
MTVTYLPIRDLKALPIDKDAPSRYGLRPGYVLSVTGYHPRKNIAGTLSAFSRFARSEGGDRQIMILCSLQPDERAEIEGMARKLGIADRVVMPGHFVEDLYSLLAGASASIFLSRYEGFGIPAAESLAAGVPLVCSNRSSLPEVCGDAAVLVDPDDEERSAEGLKRVLTSQEWRDGLIERGLRHVKKFRPEEYLRRIIEGYRNTLESLVIQEPPTPPQSKEPRLRVACFTPLPPRMSGIADYSLSLLRQLARLADVDCFVEASVGEDHSTLTECGIFEFSSFEKSHRQRPYDVILYQLGNNTHHAYVLPFVKHHPGVSVIHDFSLLGLKRQMARNYGRRFEMMLQFAEEYPAADAKVWDDDSQLDRLSFEEFPMTGGEMRASRSVIVHSEWLARLAGQMLPGADVAVIPLGVDLNAKDRVRETRAEIRRRFLLPEKAFVILSIGVINRLKRLDVVMDAFVDFHKRHPDSRFVLMGPADRILLRSLNHFTAAHRIKHAVHILGHRSTEEMYEMISASDVCVNLRYPSMGESSATLAMIMAMGCPGLVTPVGQFKEFPDDVCGKIPLGAGEKAAMVRQFEELHETPETGRCMGEKARAFVEDRGWPDVARRYCSCLIKAASEKSDQVPARVEQVDNEIESETL